VLADRRPIQPVRAARLAVAALVGTVLGLVNLVAAAWLAPNILAGHWAVRPLRQDGPGFDLNPLHHNETWRAIGLGLVEYPLWTVSGVAVATLLGAGVRVLVAGLFLPVAGELVTICANAVPGRWDQVAELGRLLGVGWALHLPLLPATTNVLVVKVVATGPPSAAMGALAFALGYTTILTAAARRSWRRRHGPPAAVTLGRAYP
jgi:hypothetical protein